MNAPQFITSHKYLEAAPGSFSEFLALMAPLLTAEGWTISTESGDTLLARPDMESPARFTQHLEVTELIGFTAAYRCFRIGGQAEIYYGSHHLFYISATGHWFGIFAATRYPRDSYGWLGGAVSSSTTVGITTSMSLVYLGTRGVSNNDMILAWFSTMFSVRTNLRTVKNDIPGWTVWYVIPPFGAGSRAVGRVVNMLTTGDSSDISSTPPGALARFPVSEDVLGTFKNPSYALSNSSTPLTLLLRVPDELFNP